MLSTIICLLPCLLSIVLAAENWTPLNQEVCFEAKGDRPGTFKLTKAGFLQGVRLTHKNGGVKCSHGGELTNFGCNYQWVKGGVGVVITDIGKSVIFPLEHIKHLDWTFFHSSGNHENSAVLSYYNDHKPTYFEAGTEFKVWYAEDLHNKSEGDNSGKSCSTVSVLYAE